MKKTILFGAILSAGFASAQMTQANEPALGTTPYYLADSNAVTYDNITGANVTWNFSTLAGYSGETKNISVEASNSTNFPNSTKKMNIDNQLITHFFSSATERTSEGFSFNSDQYGQIVVKLNTNNEKLVEYDFEYGDSFTDSYSGSVNLSYSGAPVSVPITGVAHASIDGKGTLLMPDGSSLSNVIRYNFTDTTSGSLSALGMNISLDIVRSQYEYYDYANSNMPVLVVIKLKATQVGSTQPMANVGLTLSSTDFDQYVGMEENELSFGVYPNPTKDFLTIKGNFSGEALVEIIDQMGRTISSTTLTNKTVSVDELQAGTYFVRVSNEGKTSTKTFVKK